MNEAALEGIPIEDLFCQEAELWTMENEYSLDNGRPMHYARDSIDITNKSISGGFLFE